MTTYVMVIPSTARHRPIACVAVDPVFTLTTGPPMRCSIRISSRKKSTHASAMSRRKPVHPKNTDRRHDAVAPGASASSRAMQYPANARKNCAQARLALKTSVDLDRPQSKPPNHQT